MAEKRMFTQKIIDSDAFLDMPLSTQALYFHLNMRADDDGFVNNPKRIQRTISASEDDLKLLIAKRFVIGFESGVIVIKHWRMHNTLKKDRYNPTQYQEELARLDVKDNKSYTEKQCIDVPAVACLPSGNSAEPSWNQTGSSSEPQYSKDKYSKDKYSEDKGNIVDSSESAPPVSCQQIVDLYNSICKSFPSVRSLSDARRKAIKARLNTYSLEDFKTVFENAEASSFLKGSNDRNWSANFDWIIKDANIAKVLEGQYADKPKRYGRTEVVPSWMNAGNRQLDEDEIAAINRMLGKEPGAAERAAIRQIMASSPEEDPAVEAEAEQLRQMMQEKYGK